MSDSEWGYKVPAGKTPRERHFGLGYAEGLADGRRRERSALLKFLRDEVSQDSVHKQWLKDWCAARSKRK